METIWKQLPSVCRKSTGRSVEIPSAPLVAVRSQPHSPFALAAGGEFNNGGTDAMTNPEPLAIAFLFAAMIWCGVRAQEIWK